MQLLELFDYEDLTKTIYKTEINQIMKKHNGFRVMCNLR